MDDYYEFVIDSFGSIKEKQAKLPKYGAVVIQGPSGSGKSTFLNSILWLIDSHGSRTYSGVKQVQLNTANYTVNRAGSTHITMTLYDQKLQNDPKFSNQEFCKEFVKKELKYLAVWPDYKDFVNSSRKERLELFFENFGISESYLKQCETQLTFAVGSSSSSVDTLKKLIPSLNDTSNVTDLDVNLLKENLDSLMNDLVTSRAIITQQTVYKEAQEKAKKEERAVAVWQDLAVRKAEYSEHCKYLQFCELINEIKSLSLNNQELGEYNQMQLVGYDGIKHDVLKKRIAVLENLGQCILTCPQCDSSVVVSSAGLELSTHKRKCNQNHLPKVGRTLEQEDELTIARSELTKYDAFDVTKFRHFQNRINKVEELKLKKASLGEPIGYPMAKKAIEKLETIIKEEGLKPASKDDYLANRKLGEQWDAKLYEHHTNAIEFLQNTIDLKRAAIRDAELANMNQNIRDRYDEAVTTLEQDKRRLDIWDRTKSKHVLRLCDRLARLTNSFLTKCFDQCILIDITPEKNGIDLSITYDLEHRALREMSSGEKSRIRICLILAMAQLAQCKILVLDELLNTLDAENSSKCWNMISSFSLDQKILILVASHQYLPNAHKTIII